MSSARLYFIEEDGFCLP